MAKVVDYWTLAKMVLQTDEWQNVRMFAKKPYDLPSNSILELYVWMRNSEGELLVDDFKVRQLDCPYIEPL